MKNILIIVSVIIFHLPSFNQVKDDLIIDLNGKTIYDRGKLSEKRELFYNVNNTIEIKSSKININNLIITTNKGTINGSNGSYTYYGDQKGAVKFTIVYKHSKIDTLLNVYCKYALNPDPIIHINNYPEGKIKIDHIKDLDQVEVKYTYDILNESENFYVTTFAFQHFPKGGYAFEYMTQSDSLTIEMLDVLKKLKVGDKFYIVNVEGGDKNDKHRYFGHAQFIITE